MIRLDMKNIIFLLLVILLTLPTLHAQSSEGAYLPQVQSLDSTLLTLYAVISGEKGAERDWDLFRYLFHPEARLIPTVKGEDGKYEARYMDAETFINTSGKWMKENGFFEKEIHREVDRFGNIAQVFSTYASFRTEKDEMPFIKGINSIQLMHDGQRWWIMNIFWAPETEEHPIPERYLPGDDRG